VLILKKPVVNPDVPKGTKEVKEVDKTEDKLVDKTEDAPVVKKEDTKVAEEKLVDKKEDKSADKIVSLSITDISSPSLGNFNIKAEGKTCVVVHSDQLTALDLPEYDEKKYPKRNEYTKLVKHLISKSIQEGKWNKPEVTFTWGAQVDKFPMPVMTKAKEKIVENKEPDLVFGT